MKRLDPKLKKTIRSVQARNDPDAYHPVKRKTKAKPITLAKVPEKRDQ